jgi:aspartyl/asparaginyl beta-hydroxylase (cupin superfamily)
LVQVMALSPYQGGFKQKSLKWFRTNLPLELRNKPVNTRLLFQTTIWHPLRIRKLSR